MQCQWQSSNKMHNQHLILLSYVTRCNMKSYHHTIFFSIYLYKNHQPPFLTHHLKNCNCVYKNLVPNILIPPFGNTELSNVSENRTKGTLLPCGTSRSWHLCSQYIIMLLNSNSYKRCHSSPPYFYLDSWPWALQFLCISRSPHPFLHDASQAPSMCDPIKLKQITW